MCKKNRERERRREALDLGTDAAVPGAGGVALALTDQLQIAVLNALIEVLLIERTAVELGLGV